MNIWTKGSVEMDTMMSVMIILQRKMNLEVEGIMTS